MVPPLLSMTLHVKCSNRGTLILIRRDSGTDCVDCNPKLHIYLWYGFGQVTQSLCLSFLFYKLGIITISIYKFFIKINKIIYVKILRAQLDICQVSINVHMFTISLHLLMIPFWALLDNHQHIKILQISQVPYQFSKSFKNLSFLKLYGGGINAISWLSIQTILFKSSTL